MKQILIISGKGGTGKTTIASALYGLQIHQRKVNGIIAVDCDVDASNFPFVFPFTVIEEDSFFGMDKAVLQSDQCSSCKVCMNSCRFNAISWDKEKDLPVINTRLCEGCGVCENLCPTDTIKLEKKQAGIIYQVQTSDSKNNTYFFAHLLPGEDISGKLVTAVREKAVDYAQEHESEYILLDGSPGIGCPVIASITGVDQILIVIEPSKSALSDLKRLMLLIQHFAIPTSLVINKYDLFSPLVDEIIDLCEVNNIEIIGKIPYNEKVNEALHNNQSIIQYDKKNIVSQEIIKISEKLFN